jgi:hypothetical protein
MYRMQLLGLVLICAIFLWLPFEDTGTNWALLLAAACTAWGAAWFLARRGFKEKRDWRRLPVAGLLAGLAVAPLAIFLMAVKSGAHGHLAADFTVDQILIVLFSTPVWALAGLLIGGGLGLAERARTQSAPGR